MPAWLLVPLQLLGSGLKKYWKYIAVGAAVLGVVWWLRHDAVVKARQKDVIAAQEELLKRYKEDQKVVDQGKVLDGKISKARKDLPAPGLSVYYSCLLSGDPFQDEGECAKKSRDAARNSGVQESP